MIKPWSFILKEVFIVILQNRVCCGTFAVLVKLANYKQGIYAHEIEQNQYIAIGIPTMSWSN